MNLEDIVLHGTGQFQKDRGFHVDEVLGTGKFIETAGGMVGARGWAEGK